MVGLSSGDDPNYSTSVVATNKLKSSYYFGLDWNGYVTGFTSSERIQKLNEIIDCQDTFYEFKFNRVYTVSNLIDQYKKGGRGRFIGIKEIDDSSCNSTVNKFPANDGFKNFNILFFVFSIINASNPDCFNPIINSSTTLRLSCGIYSLGLGFGLLV
jgi:hypothetical protein